MCFSGVLCGSGPECLGLSPSSPGDLGQEGTFLSVARRQAGAAETARSQGPQSSDVGAVPRSLLGRAGHAVAVVPLGFIRDY